MSTSGWKKKICTRGHVSPPRDRIGACIPCREIYAKEYYTKNKAKKVAQAIEQALRDPEARRDQQRAYGRKVPVAVIRKIIAEAKWICGACSSPVTHKSLQIDHCHKTGKIRGVLCRTCNVMEGMLIKCPNRPELLKAYIERAKNR